MTGDTVGPTTRLTTDRTPRHRLKFGQTKAALHRKLWLKQGTEAHTASERVAPGMGCVHVGGVPRRNQQQKEGEEESRAQTSALPARPRLKTRASFSFGTKTRPATALSPHRRHAGASPSIAPELGSGQRKPGSSDPGSLCEHVPGPSAAPEVDRRCFSPHAPRGFYDSRSNNGHVWIDRHSPRNRRPDTARSTGSAGHRWVGCAETRWKAMRLHTPAASTMPSARSSATQAAVQELHEQHGKRASQAPRLQIEGFQPSQRGLQTIGHLSPKVPPKVRP